MKYYNFLNKICDSMCDEKGNPKIKDLADVEIKILLGYDELYDIEDIELVQSVNTVEMDVVCLKLSV